MGESVNMVSDVDSDVIYVSIVRGFVIKAR